MSTAGISSVGGLEEKQRRLGRDLENLSQSVEELKRRHRATEATTGRLSQGVDRLEDRVDEHDDILEKHGRTLDRDSARLERFVKRLLRLEDVLRATDGVPVAELDDVPAKIRALASVADRRHSLAGRLLSRHTRAQHEQTMREYPTVVGQLATTEDALVQLIVTIANRHRNDLARAGETAKFIETRDSWQFLRDEGVPRAQRARLAAQHALESDDAVSAKVRPQLRTAERAWADSKTELRKWLADAINSSKLLPAWFTHALGVAPPRGTDADFWMTTATDVLAYRITYEIRDQVVPLGSAEGSDRWPSHRTTWHAQLRNDLESLDAGE